MGRIADEALFKLVHDYLGVYLPGMRRVSEHTVKSYRAVINQLLDFAKERHGVSLAGVTFAMLGRDTVAAYLDHVEQGRRCSAVTRNHRLACIRSFFDYAAASDPGLMFQSAELRKIPLKKTPARAGVDYMSEEAVKAMLDQPDASMAKGLRDRFLMVLLYDTGARIQELLGIRLADVRADATPTVLLHGKGGKARTVPIMQRTAEHLEGYLAVFHGDGASPGDCLFYTGRAGARHKMSDDNVRKMMKGYAASARAKCPSVPESVHPHLWRHSRAMHLYQHGMDLTLVSQWLGHSSPSTTLVYAYADTEHKRRAIEGAMSEQGIIAPESAAERYTISDERLIKRLYGLI
jgi:site-specific recombinase XerD